MYSTSTLCNIGKIWLIPGLRTVEHAKQSASRGIPFSIMILTNYTLGTPRQTILVSIPNWVDHLAVLCSVN